MPSISGFNVYTSYVIFPPGNRCRGAGSCCRPLRGKSANRPFFFALYSMMARIAIMLIPTTPPTTPPTIVPVAAEELDLEIDGDVVALPVSCAKEGVVAVGSELVVGTVFGEVVSVILK